MHTQSYARDSNLFAIPPTLPSASKSNTSQDVSLALNESSASPNPSTHHGPDSPDVLQSPSPVNSLAAHYGIPHLLPRPPRTTAHTVVKSNEMLPDFESLSRNYLSMLANKPSDNTSASTTDTNMSTLNQQVEMAPPAAPQAPSVWPRTSWPSPRTSAPSCPSRPREPAPCARSGRP